MITTAVWAYPSTESQNKTLSRWIVESQISHLQRDLLAWTAKAKRSNTHKDFTCNLCMVQYKVSDQFWVFGLWRFLCLLCSIHMQTLHFLVLAVFHTRADVTLSFCENSTWFFVQLEFCSSQILVLFSGRHGNASCLGRWMLHEKWFLGMVWRRPRIRYLGESCKGEGCGCKREGCDYFLQSSFWA